ncbi:hypothetical protein [Actinocrispum sp. NPDC049592]|uniref:hypothetical protein n=1 Tax=Actinocrispum sp. NPDC049592 TaxID=3154835 RepID=UPI0034359265
MIDYRAEAERVLDGPPGKLAFRALCAALHRAGNPEDLVSHADQRLAAWPDPVREAPWSWLAALDSGVSKPGWRLVRSLGFRSARAGTAALALPDPRTEAHGVTHLDLGWYGPGGGRLATLVDTMDQWDNLRSVKIAGLSPLYTEIVARLAEHPAVARLESLTLATAQEDLFQFDKPRFRPSAGQPWRLRHVGLRALDLAHLMRSDLVPDLRSAEVLVASLDEARELAECPGLARLDRLAIGFRCGWNKSHPGWTPFFGNVIEEDDEACEEFFARADLTGLRTLEVQGTALGLGREGLGARGAAAIAASGVLRRLTSLTLELLPLGDAALTGIIAGIDHSLIEQLTLADVVATDVTISAFAGPFPRLRHLDLRGNCLGANGAQRLATEVRLPALEYLDLSGRVVGSPYYGRPSIQAIGDAGAATWVSSPNATKLTTLKLAATGLGANGLAALMSSGLRLENLDVSRNPVDAWPESLDNWGTLRTLNLTECGLGDDDIEAMTAATAPDLRSISLAYNSIRSRGARALAAWKVLPQLWELDLHDHIIGDDGLIDLAVSQAAQQLLELGLEQDCWNPNARRYDTPLPPEVVAQESFPNLDAMFLGVVDGYHGARYSSGFPPRIREDLANAPTTRPELRAFLNHLDMDEIGEDSETKPRDNDFRPNRTARHAERIEEAKSFAHRMMTGGDR